MEQPAEPHAAKAIAEGHYYKKQIACPSRVIAWSHGSRFQAALRLLGAGCGKLLDYGCGDGSFLAMAADRIREGLGADINDGQIRECRERLAGFANLRFAPIADLADASHAAAYDVVTCMETLEHCPAPIVEIVLGDLARLCKPNGRIIISVPIEIGPTFPFKYVVRKIAAWRGLSQYSYYENYSLRDAARMLFATRRTAFERPIYDGQHTHFGFNWRALRERVKERLTLDRTLFTPLGFPGGWFCSQAWFLCKPPPQRSV